MVREHFSQYDGQGSFSRTFTSYALDWLLSPTCSLLPRGEPQATECGREAPVEEMLFAGRLQNLQPFRPTKTPCFTHLGRITNFLLLLVLARHREQPETWVRSFSVGKSRNCVIGTNTCFSILMNVVSREVRAAYVAVHRRSCCIMAMQKFVSIVQWKGFTTSSGSFIQVVIVVRRAQWTEWWEKSAGSLSDESLSTWKICGSYLIAQMRLELMK